MKPSFRPYLNTTVLYVPVLCTIWCNIQTGFFFASAHTHVNTSTELRCLLAIESISLIFRKPSNLFAWWIDGIFQPVLTYTPKYVP